MVLLPPADPFSPPAGFDHPRFTVRPWSDGDAAGMAEAVAASDAHLRNRFPLAGWPAPALPPRSSSLRYVLRARDDERVLGALDLRVDGKEAAVAFWIRCDDVDRPGLEIDLEAAARGWIATSWSFAAIRWPGLDVGWEEWLRMPPPKAV